jgi:hypothetical protein
MFNFKKHLRTTALLLGAVASVALELLSNLVFSRMNQAAT